jgi:hypothetical protein
MLPDFYDEAVADVESEEDSNFTAAQLLEGVSVTDSDWTAETVLSQLQKENILLNPRFQRREAWDSHRKSKFIESLMLGLPVPQLVLAELAGVRGRYVVIDGKQRLLALQNFASKGANGLKLSGLEIRSDLNGMSWADMQGDVARRDDVASFENSAIRTTIIKGWRDEKILYLIFHRLNSGSVPLSPQELRHVLHPGPFIDFAFDYSEQSDELIALFGNKGLPDFRMRDVELLIRFMGFRYFLADYRGDLKSFLDGTVKAMNENWGKVSGGVMSSAKECENAIKFVREIFGRDSFVKWNAEGAERRFNRAVFDVMTFYFADEDVRESIISNELQGDVRSAFIQLCVENADFKSALESTTKSKSAVFTRLRVWGQSLEEVLGREVKRTSLVP